MTDATTTEPAPPRLPCRPRAVTIALALCGIYCAGLAVDLFGRAGQVQRDFAIYYYAAAAHRRGHDPYRLETLKRLSGGRAILPFIYPAAALYAFYPFTALDYERAARLYLALKLLAVAGLLLIWRNVFLGGRGGVFFYLFCLVGFNAAIYIDLMSGNIAVFEQLALWTALACLVAGRGGLFAVLIALAAVFKLTPILFLALPPLLQGRRGLRPCLLGAAVFGLLLGVSTVLPYGREFWTAAGGKTTDEFGVLAPSTHAFIRACCGLAAALLKTGPVAEALPNILYGLTVAAILALSWRAWRKNIRAKARTPNEMGDARWGALFFCVVYALVLPRFKDYSYILLLAPTVALVRRWEDGRGLPLLALALLIYPANTVFRLPGLSVLFPFLLNYFPWAIAAAVWILYLKTMTADRKNKRFE